MFQRLHCLNIEQTAAGRQCARRRSPAACITIIYNAICAAGVTPSICCRAARMFFHILQIAHFPAGETRSFAGEQICNPSCIGGSHSHGSLFFLVWSLFTVLVCDSASSVIQSLPRKPNHLAASVAVSANSKWQPWQGPSRLYSEAVVIQRITAWSRRLPMWPTNGASICRSSGPPATALSRPDASMPKITSWL